MERTKKSLKLKISEKVSESFQFTFCNFVLDFLMYVYKYPAAALRRASAHRTASIEGKAAASECVPADALLSD